MPPRIAAFPKCYIDDIGPGKAMNLLDWVGMSTELDAEGLELYAPFLDSHDAHYLDTVRESVETTNRCIPMLCCSPDLNQPDSQLLAAEMQKQRRNMKTAALLGCQTCRVLSGQAHPSVSVESGLSQVIRCIRGLLPLAHESGITLALENHYKDGSWRYPEFAQKQELFLQIVNAIDDDHFGVQFDPSNAIVAGDDPIELLETVKDRVVSVHASDRFCLPGHTLEELALSNGDLGYSPILRHGEVGKGLNDYNRIFMILAQIGYHGWISIEDGENGMDEMKRSIEFLKRKRRQYYD